jgi:hypothetical protein
LLQLESVSTGITRMRIILYNRKVYQLAWPESVSTCMTGKRVTGKRIIWYEMKENQLVWLASWSTVMAGKRINFHEENSRNWYDGQLYHFVWRKSVSTDYSKKLSAHFLENKRWILSQSFA